MNTAVAGEHRPSFGPSFFQMAAAVATPNQKLTATTTTAVIRGPEFLSVLEDDAEFCSKVFEHRPDPSQSYVMSVIMKLKDGAGRYGIAYSYDPSSTKQLEQKGSTVNDYDVLSVMNVLQIKNAFQKQMETELGFPKGWSSKVVDELQIIVGPPAISAGKSKL
jgi:hypothetical protein